MTATATGRPNTIGTAPASPDVRVHRTDTPPAGKRSFAGAADWWQRAIDITGASIVMILVLVLACRAMQG